MPKGMTITLESAKPTWFYGENVLLYYRIQNTGTETFNVDTGGDSRNSRAIRFKVSAIASDGKPVEDPEPVQMNFGGLGGGGEIKPGASRYENVYVLEYCLFERPGTYKITVFHDLGGGKQIAADPREISTTITLNAATEEQARAILHDDETAPQYNGVLMGTRAEPRLDYFRIRNPVFLPALVERAQNGNEKALTGIEGIRTLDATKALAALLDSNDATFSDKVLSALEPRVPHPDEDVNGPWGIYRKQNIVSNAWAESLRPPITGKALKLLATNKRDDFLQAASLLRCVGTPHELPEVMSALDYATAHLDNEFKADLGYPQPVSACDRLIEAAILMDGGQGGLPKDIETPAHALIYLRRSGKPPAEKDYDAARAKLLNHSAAYVRAKTLDTLATNVPASLRDRVTARMKDEDPSVKAYAFQAARNMDDPQHRDIALAALKASDDQWLRGSASDIALKYGARYDCAVAWVSHLVRPHDMNDYTAHDALLHLSTIMMHPARGGANGGGGFNPPMDDAGFDALRKRWLAFLDAHKAEINDGHAFNYGDGVMPADLLPSGFDYH